MLLGAIAIDPMKVVGRPSVSGRHETPAFVVFQTPPPAAAMYNTFGLLGSVAIPRIRPDEGPPLPPPNPLVPLIPAGPIGVQLIEFKGIDVERSVRSSRNSASGYQRDRSRADRRTDFVRDEPDRPDKGIQRKLMGVSPVAVRRTLVLRTAPGASDSDGCNGCSGSRHDGGPNSRTLGLRVGGGRPIAGLDKTLSSNLD